MKMTGNVNDKVFCNGMCPTPASKILETLNAVKLLKVEVLSD